MIANPAKNCVLAHIFPDSLKDFGFLVTLLYIIGKKVIFPKFSDFRWKYLICYSWSQCSIYQINTRHVCWANLVQKFKIVSLSWNLAPRLIQVCRIQWWCSLFLFQNGNTLFGQIWSKKIKIVSLCWNLAPSLIRICRIQWWCSLLPFLTGNTLFGQIWSKNSKLSV